MNIFTPSAHTAALASLATLTSPLQPSSHGLDLPSALDLSDKLRGRIIPPELIAADLSRILSSSNPHELTLAALLTDVLLKNAGSDFFAQLSTEHFSRTLERALLDSHNTQVKAALLELIQSFALMSANNPSAHIRTLYSELKYRRTVFPPVPMLNPTAAVHTVQPPVWTNAAVCHKCRAAFTLLNRRHHCRACGNAFCGQCAAEQSELPELGLEGKQRVCLTCANSRGRKSVGLHHHSQQQQHYDDYGFPVSEDPQSVSKKRVTFNPTESRRSLSESQTGFEELEAEEEQMKWAIQESLKTNPSQPPPALRRVSSIPDSPPAQSSYQPSSPTQYIPEVRKKYVPVALPQLPPQNLRSQFHNQHQQYQPIPRPYHEQEQQPSLKPEEGNELDRMSRMTHILSGVMKDLDEVVVRYSALQWEQKQREQQAHVSRTNQMPITEMLQQPYQQQMQQQQQAHVSITDQIPFTEMHQNHYHSSLPQDINVQSNPYMQQLSGDHNNASHQLFNQQPISHSHHSSPHQNQIFTPTPPAESLYTNISSQSIRPSGRYQEDHEHSQNHLQLNNESLQKFPQFPSAPTSTIISWPAVPVVVPSPQTSQKEEQLLIEL